MEKFPALTRNFSCKSSEKSRQFTATTAGLTAMIETGISQKRSRSAERDYDVV